MRLEQNPTYTDVRDFGQAVPDAASHSIVHSIGCGCPAQSKHQADNLAKLRLEFLSVIELIAKIFGAVRKW